MYVHTHLPLFLPVEIWKDARPAAVRFNDVQESCACCGRDNMFDSEAFNLWPPKSTYVQMCSNDAMTRCFLCHEHGMRFCPPWARAGVRVLRQSSVRCCALRATFRWPRGRQKRVSLRICLRIRGLTHWHIYIYILVCAPCQQIAHATWVNDAG